MHFRLRENERWEERLFFVEMRDGVGFYPRVRQRNTLRNWILLLSSLPLAICVIVHGRGLFKAAKARDTCYFPFEKRRKEEEKSENQFISFRLWAEQKIFCTTQASLPHNNSGFLSSIKYQKKLPSHTKWLVGLGVWFSLRVREVPGSNPGRALGNTFYKFRSRKKGLFSKCEKQTGVLSSECVAYLAGENTVTRQNCRETEIATLLRISTTGLGWRPLLFIQARNSQNRRRNCFPSTSE